MSSCRPSRRCISKFIRLLLNPLTSLLLCHLMALGLVLPPSGVWSDDSQLWCRTSIVHLYASIACLLLGTYNFDCAFTALQAACNATGGGTAVSGLLSSWSAGSSIWLDSRSTLGTSQIHLFKCIMSCMIDMFGEALPVDWFRVLCWIDVLRMLK